MNQLNSIVVGVDFSENSRAALDQAVRRAGRNHARLVAMHVLEPEVVAELARAHRLPEAQVARMAQARALKYLQEWVGEGHSFPVDLVVVHGNPLEMLLRKASELEADLIVLGEAGSTEPNEGPGVLASNCLRRAECKVMLVDSAHRSRFRLVLACIDFSETSRQVVDQALRVAKEDGAVIHFLHVYSPPWMRRSAFGFLTNEAGHAHRLQRDAIRQRLEEFVGASPGDRIRVDVHESTSVDGGIAAYARILHADLVILGIRSAPNAQQVLLGSSAERLLRLVPSSVLGVPATAEKERRPAVFAANFGRSQPRADRCEAAAVLANRVGLPRIGFSSGTL